jgi:WD40 repeat protein
MWSKWEKFGEEESTAPSWCKKERNWGVWILLLLCFCSWFVRYDSSSFAVKQVIKPVHKKRINQMCVSSTALYSASEDGSVIMWNVQTKEVIRTVKAHESRCNSVILVGDKLWTCGWDTTSEDEWFCFVLDWFSKFCSSVRIFDAQQLNPLQTLSGYHDDAVFALLLVSKDFVWSVSGDRGIVVWTRK